MAYSKGFLFIGLLLVVALSITSEVSARELAAETNDVVEDGHGHYGGGHGGHYGGGHGHYGGGGGHGHYGGGGHGHYGGGGHGHYGGGGGGHGGHPEVEN